MAAAIRQPPTEAVLGAPLQVDERDDEVVVRIRDQGGRLQELKRFRPP